jgi:hypothetical protein
MTPAWIHLWTRTMDISVGAPEVISRRLQLMQPQSLWAPKTVFEMQGMVLEKAMAALESGWALYRSGLQTFAWPAFGSALWWAPAHQRRLSQHALRSANRALAPLSRRVKANVKRLRSN